MNEKIQELTEKLKTTYDEEKIDTLVWLGFLLHNSDVELAERYLQEALDSAKKLNYQKGKANIYRILMVIETIKGNTANATNFGLRALKIFEKLDIKQGVADVYNNLGGIYGDNDLLSLEYYLKALKIKEEIGDVYGIGQTYQNIGALYRRQKEFDTAMEYLEKALRIFQQQNSLLGIEIVYGNMGLVYEDKVEYSQAVEYQKKSLEIAKKLDHQHLMASSMVNLGISYKNMGEYDQALAYYRQGLQIYEELKNKNFMAACLINIGRAEMMRQNYETAIDYLNRGLELAEKADAKDRIQNAYENLSELYQYIGKYKEALEYHHRFVEIKNEIFNIEKSKQIALIHTRYETEKNQLKIQHLEEKLNLKEENLKKIVLSFSQINEFVQTTSLELKKITKQKPSKRDILAKIATIAESCQDNGLFWQDFSSVFDDVHGDFIHHLTERCPDLTPREIQVCMLVRTNLSSKEIAETLYLSIRTVGEYRHRIRTKLGLSSDRNLTSFLLSI